MLMKYLFPALVLLLAACQNKETNPVTAPAPAEPTTSTTVTATAPEPQTKSALQEKMLGVWSNEANPDGIFDITDSTFYYAHNYEDYRYQLKGNVLTINYPNATYTGKVSFSGDTLIMASDEGTAKYWRYNNK